MNDPSASNSLRLDDIKEKLELLCEEKVKGIVIRARARWHEYDEKSVKYFLNLEKRNHVKKHIRKSLITTDPYRILSKQKRFYHNLYEANDSAEASDSIEAFLNSLNIPNYRKNKGNRVKDELLPRNARQL